MVLLSSVDVQTEIIRRGVVLAHVQRLDEIDAALRCLVGLAAQVEQDRPPNTLERTTHQQRVVLSCI